MYNKYKKNTFIIAMDKIMLPIKKKFVSKRPKDKKLKKKLTI